MLADLYLRSSWFTRLLLSVIALASSSLAMGTDRFFADLSVSSENGRYILSAVSPQNSKDIQWRAFARDFVYTLSDTEDDKVVWTRLQADAEASPQGAFVDNSGWVVVWTARERLLVLEPGAGDVRCNINILEQFTDAEQESFVSHTTAGPSWTDGSIWIYMNFRGSVFFIIQPWWGHTVVVDLDANRVLDEPDEEFQRAQRSAEVAWTLSTLTTYLEEYENNTDVVYGTTLDALGALNAVGRYHIDEAVPLLRRLEVVDVIQSSGGYWDRDNELQSGEINPFNYSRRRFRQAVQFTLRELGEVPQEFPCTSFSTTRERKILPHIELPAPRAERVSLLQPGQRAEAVIDAIGTPDFVFFQRRTWEYDMDTEDPYTLRVQWKSLTEVDRIEIVRPALWQQDITRRKQIFMGY